MNKIFIIGLPRTGTTSVSVALLEHGFNVAHTAFTKRAFELADVISDAPCFSDYQQLDSLFPESRYVYLDRPLEKWLPSIQMLLKKMQEPLDIKTGYFNPVLKRSFNETFKLSSATNPFDSQHLETCYQVHKEEVLNYFSTRDDFLSIDIGQSGSLGTLLSFLDIAIEDSTEESSDANINFPRLNIGKQVDSWKEFKHPNKVNPNSAGVEHRKFFDYHLSTI